jgi:hypothetical protein
MTDEEFDSMFMKLSNHDMLEFLAKNVRTIIVRNGTAYDVQNRVDLICVVEQEMYQQLTGRE